MKRSTIRMEDSDWMRLKLIAAMKGKSIQECFEDALGDWMLKHSEELGDVLSKAEDIANSQQQDQGDDRGEVLDRPTAASPRPYHRVG